MTVKHWNTGLAAARARHNLKLKLKKKIQPEVEATSRKRQATMKKIIYCRFCDQLTTEKVKEINDRSIDEVSSTEDCEDCRVIPMKKWQKLVRESR